MMLTMMAEMLVQHIGSAENAKEDANISWSNVGRLKNMVLSTRLLAYGDPTREKRKRLGGRVSPAGA